MANISFLKTVSVFTLPKHFPLNSLQASNLITISTLLQHICGLEALDRSLSKIRQLDVSFHIRNKRKKTSEASQCELRFWELKIQFCNYRNIFRLQIHPEWEATALMIIKVKSTGKRHIFNISKFSTPSKVLFASLRAKPAYQIENGRKKQDKICTHWYYMKIGKDWQNSCQISFCSFSFFKIHS